MTLFWFSELSTSKVRPAIVVGAPHTSVDAIIVPLTSRTHSLLGGEFVLAQWSAAGLNVASAIKRGVYTVHPSLIVKTIGSLSVEDVEKLTTSLRLWLEIS